MSSNLRRVGLLAVLFIVATTAFILSVPMIGYAVSMAFAGCALALGNGGRRTTGRAVGRIARATPYVLWIMFWLWLTATPGLALFMRGDLYLYSAINVLTAVLFLVALLVGLGLREHSATGRAPFVSTLVAILFVVAAQSLLQSPLFLGPRTLAVWGSLAGIASQVGFVVLAVRYAPKSADLLRDMTRGVVIGGTLTALLLALMGGGGAGRFGDADVLHPNTVGGLAAIGFLSALSAGQFSGRFTRLLGLTALPVVMALSLSKTSLVACAVSVAIWVLMSQRQDRGHRTLLLVSAVLVVSFFVGDEVRSYFTSYLADTERVETLSERTVLWTATLERSAERPVRGFGFATFPDALAARDNLGWNVHRIAHAHNAYLTMLLEQGYIGLGLFAGLVILYAVLLIRLWRREGRGQLVLAGAAILAFLIVRSITEGALAMRSDFAYLCAMAVMLEARLAGRRSPS